MTPNLLHIRLTGKKLRFASGSAKTYPQLAGEPDRSFQEYVLHLQPLVIALDVPQPLELTHGLHVQSRQGTAQLAVSSLLAPAGMHERVEGDLPVAAADVGADAAVEG